MRALVHSLRPELWSVDTLFTLRHTDQTARICGWFVVPTHFSCSCWTLWCWEQWVHEPKGRHNMSWAAQGVLWSRRVVVVLIAPRACEWTSTQVRVATALQCGLYTSQVVWVMFNICHSYVIPFAYKTTILFWRGRAGTFLKYLFRPLKCWI